MVRVYTRAPSWGRPPCSPMMRRRSGGHPDAKKQLVKGRTIGMLTWLKKGNRSAATAAAGNFIIALSKGIAAFVSGSGSMLATTVHSVADTLNQLFVFFGSILAEKEPTRRFPAGFGRTVNLFVLIAVMIIGIMAYETIKEGWNLIQNPHPSEHILINASVLVIAILIDG